MSFLLLDPVEETTFETFHEHVPAGFGEGVSAVASDPILRPALQLAPVQQEIAEAEGIERPRSLLPARRGVLPRLGEPEPVNPEALTAVESPERLNEEYGHLGLKFDRPTRRGVAEILAREKRAERVRADILSRAPSGVLFTTAALGASFVSAAIDPLNVAAAFIPVAREGRLAGMIARLSTPARQRLAIGAIEGAVGNALIEPGVMVMSHAQQRDYGMADALLNVTLGAGIGAGFRFGFGAIGDRLARLSPETREVAARAAIAQAVEGRQIDVDPVLRGSPEIVPEIAVEEPVAFRLRPVERDVSVAPDDALPVTFPDEVHAELFALGDDIARRRTTRRESADRADSLFRALDGFVEDDPGAGARFRRVADVYALARDYRDAVIDDARAARTVEREPSPGRVIDPDREADFVEDMARAEIDRQIARPQITRQDIPQIAHREMDPRRDATADFEASARADAELVEAGDFTPERLAEMTDREASLIGRAAEEEASFEAALLEDMKGILGPQDLRAIEDIDAIVSRAEDYAMAVRTAAACMARA